eukprot:scaffold44126_cov51-Phaeocystis_antarctica.AAC.2
MWLVRCCGSVEEVPWSLVSEGLPGMCAQVRESRSAARPGPGGSEGRGSRLMMDVNEKVSPVVEIRVTALQGSTSISSERPEKTDGHNESLFFCSRAKPVVHPSLEASDIRGGLDWLAD